MFLKLKSKLHEVILLKDPPERLALSFAVGIFIAFSPAIGFHTLLVFTISYLFRLNVCSMFLGAVVNNPWTMVPIYAWALWFGMLCTGQAGIVDIVWSDLTFSNFLIVLGPYIVSFCTGTVTLGIICGTVSYFMMKKFIIEMRAKV